MNKIVDLHMHTIYSDGKLLPKDLIKLAYDNGINIMSITDHDSIMGLKNLNNIYDIKIINGIEMTAYYQGQSIHILGYGIDIENEYLNKKLEELRTSKFYLMLKVIDLLKIKYNIVFSSYDISNYFNNIGTIGRVGLADLCVKYKYAKSISEAFVKYLNKIYDFIDDKTLQLTPKDCIDLIHAANGYATVAHLYELKYENKEEIIKYLKDLGLDAIEVYHSTHDSKKVEECLEYAKKYNLLITGGSDYHGEDIKEKIPITYAVNNNIIEDKITLLSKLGENDEM